MVTKMKILIMDSDRQEVRQLTGLISGVRDVDMEIEVAEDINRGLSIAGREEIDIILLDLLFPGERRISAIRVVHESLPDIPVILLAGSENEAAALVGLREGAQDYLIKGTFDSNLLVRCIRHAIERQKIKGELKKTIQQLSVSEERLYNIIYSNSDGIVIVDRENRVSFINPAAEYILNKTKAHLLGSEFEYPIEIGGTREIEIRRSDDDVTVAEMKVVVIKWEGKNAFLISYRDITELVKMREKLKGLAFQDELTGIRNRRAFLVIAEKMISIADRSGRELNLYFMDMDNMKWINDNLGHLNGDRALVIIASILKGSMRASDTVARVGGDEFAIMAVDSTVEGGKTLQENLYKAFAERNSSGDLPFELAVSIGMAHYDPASPCTLSELLSSADADMYRSKVKRKKNKEWILKYGSG